MIKTLSKFVREYKKYAVSTVILTAMEVVLDIFLPVYMAKIIDEGISAGNMSAVLKYGLIMALLSIAAFATGVGSGRTASKASSGFAANLRFGMFSAIQNFSFGNIDRFSTAGLVTRMTTDVNNVQMAFQMIIRMCVRAPLNLISAIIMCVIISRDLSKIFLIAAVFLAIVLFLIIKNAMKTFQFVFKEYDNLNGAVQENITGIRVVKSFVREDFETKRFQKAVDRLYQLFCKAETITCINNPVMLITIYACTLTLSWFGAHDVVAGALTTGQLTSLLSYTMNIFMSLMMLSMTFVMLTISETSGSRICEVLSAVPDISNPENPVMEIPNGSVDFNHVFFSYSENAETSVLSDIDLHIHSGETIGIIGATGSSKSSLVNLISRLYDVSSGSVMVGGIDVRKYDLKVLRDGVSVVLQNNVLFSGTILDNLRWGNPQASEEECIGACKVSCAHEFVMAREHGYNTYIERGGANVSGGQKQRLCIARALLKNPKVLIMDDSTSAVDTATEARIQKSMKNELPDVTKIIISQRISSFASADRILVLEDGKISGFGTHEELMENNEIYQSIVEVQSNGNGDFDRAEV